MHSYIICCWFRFASHGANEKTNVILPHTRSIFFLCLFVFAFVVVFVLAQLSSFCKIWLDVPADAAYLSYELARIKMLLSKDMMTLVANTVAAGVETTVATRTAAVGTVTVVVVVAADIATAAGTGEISVSIPSQYSCCRS